MWWWWWWRCRLTSDLTGCCFRCSMVKKFWFLPFRSSAEQLHELHVFLSCDSPHTEPFGTNQNILHHPPLFYSTSLCSTTSHQFSLLISSWSANNQLINNYSPILPDTLLPLRVGLLQDSYFIKQSENLEKQRKDICPPPSSPVSFCCIFCRLTAGHPI